MPPSVKPVGKKALREESSSSWKPIGAVVIGLVSALLFLYWSRGEVASSLSRKGEDESPDPLPLINADFSIPVVSDAQVESVLRSIKDEIRASPKTIRGFRSWLIRRVARGLGRHISRNTDTVALEVALLFRAFASLVDNRACNDSKTKTYKLGNTAGLESARRIVQWRVENGDVPAFMKKVNDTVFDYIEQLGALDPNLKTCQKNLIVQRDHYMNQFQNLVDKRERKARKSGLTPRLAIDAMVGAVELALRQGLKGVLTQGLAKSKKTITGTDREQATWVSLMTTSKYLRDSFCPDFEFPRPALFNIIEDYADRLRWALAQSEYSHGQLELPSMIKTHLRSLYVQLIDEFPDFAKCVATL